MRAQRLVLSLSALILASCAAEGAIDAVPEEASSLTAAQRRTRAGQIRDAAAANGITQGWLLAGIADAETQMSHCHRELTWACEGPYSADCGGPVVAGAGDGPCYLHEGGLGMFQFDAGTFDDTIRREGSRVLSIAGNVAAAVDFVVAMVIRSVHISGVDSRAEAIDWINGVRIGNGRWGPWITTVTHYYNGCAPGYSCYSSRYARYRDHTSDIYWEMGAGFWGVSCDPGGETCDGRDQDCDGRIDEGLTRSCGSDVGECDAGVQACASGSWGACSGAIGPRPETCDARDQDCDGRTDEALVRTCGTDVGECVAGAETCSVGAWGSCEGSVDPVPERCDMLDNDCDGTDDDERICEREEIAYASAVVAAASETDADGDHRADACARVGDRLSCLLSSEHGFSRELLGPTLTDAAGWSEPLVASSLRMVDLDGDGISDVCGRSEEHLSCWRSDGRSFGEAILGPTWDADVTGGELADLDGDGWLDACARDADGLLCMLSTGHGFDEVVRLPALGDAFGFGDVLYSGTMRFGDVDGDGRADVCARSAEGVDCWLSEGRRFGPQLEGPRWADADGWDQLSAWSTIRLADANGDGRADLCARTPEGTFTCVLSEGTSFGASLTGPDMLGAVWERADVYSTIRMGDLDGDGLADLCAREPEGMACWLGGARGFDARIEGPQWDDAAGFTEPAHFRTIRLADVNGDALADLCARTEAGLVCALSEGETFGRAFVGASFADESGLSDPVRAMTLRIAGGAMVTGPSAALRGSMQCTTGAGSGNTAPVALSVLLLAAIWARRSRASLR